MKQINIQNSSYKYCGYEFITVTTISVAVQGLNDLELIRIYHSHFGLNVRSPHTGLENKKGETTVLCVRGAPSLKSQPSTQPSGIPPANLNLSKIAFSECNLIRFSQILWQFPLQTSDPSWQPIEYMEVVLLFLAL